MNTKKIRSGGILFMAKNTNRVLFALRSTTVSHPNTFGFFGGKIEPFETLSAGLEREIIEEIGFFPEVISYAPFDYFISKDKSFEYSSLLVLTPEEFIPHLNHENDGYAWVKLGCWPRPLHSGAKKVLKNQTLINSFIEYSNNH